MKQGNLFDQTSPDIPLTQSIAAGQAAMGAAEAAADERWLKAVRETICGFPAERKFMPDEVVAELRRRGITTANPKAIGPVILRLAREGFIMRSGQLRAVRTSHGSLRPEWMRTNMEGEA